MAVTYALYPGATTYPGTTTYPGNVGADLYLKVLINLNTPTAASAAIWEYLEDDRVLSFSISRGRESELSDIEPGTATLVVDNRDRAFDPSFASSPYSPYIRPMTQFWIQADMGGTTYDLFLGYADTFQQEWGAGTGEATCTISLTDEFKVLALDRLPTMDPPRDSYTEVVDFDVPSAHWILNDSASTLAAKATTGPDLTAPEGLASTTVPAIVGSEDGHIILPVGSYNLQSKVVEGDILDMTGLGDYALEFWFKALAAPSGPNTLVRFPDAGGVPQLQVSLAHDGTVTVSVRTNAPATVSVTSGVGISWNTWHHIVASNTGASLQIIIDGVATSTALAATLAGPPDTNAAFVIGETGGTAVQYEFAEMAFYRGGRSNARMLAHYTAGSARGFAHGQTTGSRISDILDQSCSVAARNINPGTRDMQGSFMRGQPPLDELRDALHAEAGDAILFASHSGTVSFLDGAHRSTTPYQTPQLTLGDDTGEIPYADMGTDYSESFLANVWNVTRRGGLLQTAEDATSIDTYFQRPQSLTDLSLTTDAEALSIAVDMLAKFKDPQHRIERVALSTIDVVVAAQVLPLDLGELVTVMRTPPGGGARYDQDSRIQKIQIEGEPRKPWVITWNLSPL